MATQPLFVASVDVLKRKLRLSGVPSASNADDMIDEALLVVRSGFYREVGRSRVTKLQQIPFTENPTTDKEVTRAVANVTEVKWVRMELMRVLPMLFMDGNANQSQIYHDEAAFREATQQQIDVERARLQAEIAENLDLLRGDESVGNETKGVEFMTISPKRTPPRPGDTARPFWRRGDWRDDCL